MSSRIPVVRQISWIATIPQFVSVTLAIATGILLRQAYGDTLGVGGTLLRGAEGVVLGSGAYLLYSFGSRFLLTRHHRAGIALSKQHRFDEAMPKHQQSLEFFDRHAWIDRFRCIVLMSPSAICYRELALMNIAFCYGQIGDGKQMRFYYEECLKRFPESEMAQAALRMLDAAESAATESTD